MSTGEDEPSPGLNGRLRPRKSTTSTPSPQNKNIRKTESKLAQDRPKRTTTPSKASPSKQNDLAAKSDTSPATLFLCPYCDRKFNARQTASKHARRIHLSASKQDNFIKCLYCVHSEAESNAIIKHMVDSHPNQYFACLDCHTRFPSTTELAEHKLNVCEKQKPPYRSKLRQKTSAGTKKNPKRLIADKKSDSTTDNTQYTDDHRFNGIVISCELKPSEVHDAADVEDKITTNLILPNSKALSNAGMDKNAVIVLDDLQWNKRIPPNFSFHNTDADQILSRLGVVHRSPRVGESKKDLIRLMDEPNEKFEKCFETSFYSKVAKNVQENLAKYLDGSFNFNPDRDNTIKTRKSKTSVVINTAEGFPILLAYEQFSRNLFDGFMPRTMAPKHKWKWDSAENDNKNLVMLLDQTKRDTHVNNCIVTLVSGLDIWTQLRMRRKFEEVFKTTPAAKKTEKQNIINMELKEILESRDIPSTSTEIVKYKEKPVAAREGLDLPSYLGLSPTTSKCEPQPAVLSGEWVRPRCYVCCACGEQTRDGRALTTHISSQHPNAQVQHYEIVGETLLSADILKHLYVPPSQISNRTRPPRGFRDCTKCKKSITMEDLHQHMLDCAGDIPTVRRKVRYRPFGVRRRRPRLPDNTIRKKMRKDIRSRHRQKVHMRPRPRIRTDVGDAETIRKMIADLPAKRNRITPSNVLRPRKNVLRAKKPVKLRASEDTKSTKAQNTRNLNKIKKIDVPKKQNDTDNSSTIDEDDQPLKLSAKRASTRSTNSKEEMKNASTSRATVNKTKKKTQKSKKDPNMHRFHPNFYNLRPDQLHPNLLHPNMFNADIFNRNMLSRNMIPPDLLQQPNILQPDILRPNMYQSFPPHFYYNPLAIEQAHHTQLAIEQAHQRIDVQAAGPSNIRQHGNRDDYNIRNGNDRPVGSRHDGNQNNNVAPVANVPLKHSIASLTSKDEPRDASVPHFQSNLPPEIRVTAPHQTSEIRHEFENETMPEEFDKPPLPCNPIGFSEPGRPSSEDFRNTSENLHFPIDLVCSRETGDLSGAGRQLPLSNDHKSIEVQKDTDIKIEADKSKLSKTRKGLNDCIAMLKTKKGLVKDKSSTDKCLPEYEKGNEKNRAECNEKDVDKGKCGDEKVFPKDNIRDEQGCIDPKGVGEKDLAIGKSSNDETLTEYEGSKENNSAKDKKCDETTFSERERESKEDKDLVEYKACSENDLEECKTDEGNGKKGINETQGSETIGNESVNCESLETDSPTIDSTLSEENTTYSTTQRSESINLTPAQIFYRSPLPDPYPSGTSENGTPSVSTDEFQVAPQNDNAHRQQSKAPDDIPIEFVAPDSKQSEAQPNSSRTRPSSRTECDMTSQKAGHIEMERSQWLESPPTQPQDSTPNNVLPNKRRNSNEEMPIPLEQRLFFQHRMCDTVHQIMTLNDKNLTKAMIESQLKLMGYTIEDLNMLNNQRIASEMYMQSSKAASTSENVAQVACNNTKMATQWQATVPPTKKSRRKPAKNDSIPEPQPSFNYKRSTLHKQSAEKHTSVSSLPVPPMPVSPMSVQSMSVPPIPVPPIPVQPLPMLPLQNIRESSEDFNISLTSSNYLPPPSMGVTIPKPQTAPAPRLRREYKRVLDTSEKSPNDVNNCDDSSQHKILKRSQESNPENNTSNMENLRRHSTELTPAKSKLGQESLMAQGNFHERDFYNTSPSSRGHSKPLMASPKKLKRSDEGNVRFETPKDLHSRSPYAATFVSMSQDTHGIMYVNHEAESRDTVNSNSPTPTRELLHARKISFEDDKTQFLSDSAQKQRSKNNSESKSDDLLENKLNNQPIRTNMQTSNAIDNIPHRPGIHNSLEYYTRSSPYQSNITNINPSKVSDHTLDIVYDEHRHHHDNPLHTYDHTTHTIGVPKIPYSDSIYGAIPLMSLPREPIREEVTPLDLSCDSKIRKEKPLDSRYKSLELIKKRGGIPNINEIDSNQSLRNMNIQHNYSEQLRNLTPHRHLSSYKDFSDDSYKPDEEHSYIPAFDMIKDTEKNVTNFEAQLPKHQMDQCSSSAELVGEIQNRDVYCNNKMSIAPESGARFENISVNYQIDIFPNQQKVPNDTAQSEKSKLLDLNNSNQIKHSYSEHTTSRVVNTVNKSNFLTGELLSQTTKCDVTPINRQESMQEKSFIENKKIARSSLRQVNPIFPESTFGDNSYTTDNTPSGKNTNLHMVLINANVINTEESVDPHAHIHNITDHKKILKVPTKNADEITTLDKAAREGLVETESVKTNAQTHCQDIITEKDNISIDQDPETARKIAMLPKELLDILGTMPKDHRNQLLNVLPQYVSTSIPANKVSNTSSVTVAPKKIDTLQVEKTQQATVCNDLNRLSVNTAISPSSIIPKKRHSPSQSTSRLNSNEAQINLCNPSPTLPQLSPKEPDERPVKEANLDTNSPINNSNLETSVIDPLTDVITQKLVNKNSDYTKMNVVDLSDVENVGMSTDMSVSTENALPALTRVLTPKTPSKPRNYNEQTASLRAVRIKTTSAGKSFSDDKNTLPNYNYQNLDADEKFKKPVQIHNSVHYSYRNLNDLKYDANNPQIKNDNTAMVVPAATGIIIEDVRQDTFDTMVTFANTIREENEVTATPSNKPLVKSDIPKKLEITTVALQGTNIEQNQFLEPMNSTTVSSSRKHKDVISLQKINMVIPHNNSKTKERLLKPTLSLDIDDRIIDSTTETKESVTKEIVLSASLDGHDDAKLNSKQSSQYITFERGFDSSLELLNQSSKNLQEVPLLKSAESNEDDSDDDISLAVIKRKQCEQPIINKADFSTPAHKQNRVSAKLVNKKKKPQSKKGKTSRRKKLSLNTEIVHGQNLSIESINNEVSDIEVGFIDKEVERSKKTTKALSVNTKDVDCKLIKDNYEFDVNKENSITENINKIKDDENSQLPDHDPIESQLDNSIDKNIYSENKEVPKVNLQPGDNSISSVETIKDSGAVDVKYDFEINEMYNSAKESQAKRKKNKISKSFNGLENKNKSHKSEIAFENSSDIGSKNETNQFTSSKVDALDMNNLTSDNVEFKKLPDVCENDSTKNITFAIAEKRIVSDLQLCSEITETKFPLRRSRRGKSMYADSSYLQDNELDVLSDDIGNKAPLTMKRLILSRVEKDKRISQSAISEKDSDATDEQHLSDTEIKKTCIKKGKPVKRKKSPHSRRKSKKTKAFNNYQTEEDTSDINMSNTSENKMSILRELPNAENKIKDKDTPKEEVKSFAVSDTSATLSDKSTLVIKEINSDVNDDDLIDVNEKIMPEKRKLNITTTTDLALLKSKKIKYDCNEKATSDFDSDDEKGLLETKQKVANQSQSMLNTDNTNNTSTKNVEDNGHNIHDKSINTCDGLNIDFPKEISSANITGETRTTCYSRPISVRKPRSSSASFKDDANYDPYNIDFEDMIEPTGPIIKKKGRGAGNSAKYHQEEKCDAKSEDVKLSNLNILSNKYDAAKSDTSKMISNLNNESDSDSSKSDVPLQKYVNEKKMAESAPKNKISRDGMDPIENTAKQEVTQTCNNTKATLDNSAITAHNEETESKRRDAALTVEIARSSYKAKKSTKRVNKDESLCEAETTKIGQNLNTNNKLEEPSLHKQQNKEKKSRRTLSAYNNVDSISVSNEAQSKEVDQQMKSDKFMENFGFYSERIPRKSNLLASKKISETFHMISNESDDSYFAYKEKPAKKSTQNENKKKSETSSDVPASQDARTMTSDGTSFIVQPTESRMDVGEPYIANVPYDETKMDDSEVDSITAQRIMESEEVRNLENDLISGLKEAADANAAQNCFVNYQHTSTLETIAPIEDAEPTVSIMHAEEGSHKMDENPVPVKKPNKNKPNKQPGVKELMYPEEEIEIDMFEDKFDKIKRKRRSQAVAAKQVQNTVETNSSVKSRRQSEKKRTTKNTKKNYKSTQVPTKGALKGFDGIKISIRTQDLNMPPSVSPPGQQKKRKKLSTKRRKETSDTDSSCSESDEKEKNVLERDIYEFKDSEDTELLELRPSTVMDRFRIMHNKTKFKHKDKGKGDVEKERQRDRKEKRADTKEKEFDEKEKIKEREKKYVSRHEGRSKEKVSISEQKLSFGEISSKFDENTRTTEMNLDQPGASMNDMKEVDRAVASTSGFVPDRIDESDYESELSSPEGEFIFYMSDDINCVCPSDNDSDADSDVERGCGRPNCIYKIRNADKNAAIGNIFKNNAVRCEKPETKEPEQPKPNMDQLFDSLFESKPTNSDVVSENTIEVAPETMDLSPALILSSAGNRERSTRKSLSPVLHPDLQIAPTTKEATTSPLIKSCGSKSSQDPVSLSKPLAVTNKNKSAGKNTKSDQMSVSVVSNTSSLYQNEIMSDSDSIQMFTIGDKPKDELRYSIMTEECTQVQLEDIIADEKVAQNEANEKNTINIEHLSLKTSAADHTTKYNSEDEFDINKPESLKREYMHYILPADKVSSCAQTEPKSDHSDAESGNESAATKYLKELSPAEAAKIEIYTMVTAQGTQTVRPKRHSSTKHDPYALSMSEDEGDQEVVPRSRIRLQKFDITDITHKSKSSKSIQTDKTKVQSKSSKYDVNAESDDDDDVIKSNDRVIKKADSAKGKSSTGSSSVFNEDNEMSPPEDSFATPASITVVNKHSPRKSDEGISTSHDYSADTFDQASFEDTGVACQRARRKCTVGKQNVLAEHWSSESEFDGLPPRPNSADSVVASAGRKKKGRKKEGHHSGGRRGSRHASKNESKGARARATSGGRSDNGDACAAAASGPSRAPIGPKIRARPAHHYWSSDGEETPGPQPQHGWIVGDSHKKLVTMLAHAKGRKRNNSDKRHFLD